MKNNGTSRNNRFSLRSFVFEQKCVPWKVRLVCRRLLPWKLRRVMIRGRWNSNSPGEMDKRYALQGDNFVSMANLYDHVIKLLPDSGKCIDVGCGIAVLLRRIKGSKPALELYGVDFSQVAIERTANYGFEAKRAFLPEIPYADNSFDALVCTEVLEHLEDPATSVREFHRILKPGGIMIVSVPKNMGPDHCDEHIQDFNEQSLRQCLDQNLFDIETIELIVREPHRSPGESFLAYAKSKKKVFTLTRT